MSSLNYLVNILIATLFGFVLMLMFRVIIMVAFGERRVLLNNKKDMLSAFVLGARFDLKIIGAINALPILSAIIIYSFSDNTLYHIFNNGLLYYYFAMYFLLSVILMIDIGFFSYFNEHINYLIFGFLDDDTKALIQTMRDNYNVPLYSFLIILYMVLLYGLLKWFWVSSIQINYFALSQTIWLTIMLIVNFLFARGNLKGIPLGIMHAQVSNIDFINKLAINGVMTYVKSLKQRRENNKGQYDLAKKFGFSERMPEAMKRVHISEESVDSFTAAMRQHVPNNPDVSDKPHVVLVMMESFATHLLSFENNNLDLLASMRPHFQDDIVFKNFTSDGQGTIESFLTAVTNLPHRPDCANYTESDLLNKFIPSSIAATYKKQGYETTLLYGGGLSWRNIGIFLKHQHFDHIDGDAQIKKTIPLKTKSYDHPWGVHDEYTFDYLTKLLNKAETPQFVVVLTTSNHPPFVVPETYQAKPYVLPDSLKERLLCKQDIMEQRCLAYQYANDCAGHFLNQIKNSSLKNNTIVAMTGDHAFWGMYQFKDAELYQRYTVPFYCYIPTRLRPKNVDVGVFGSHKDIAATLYHISLSDVEYLSIGTNLFEPQLKHYSFNSAQLVAGKAGMVVQQNKFYTWGDGQTVIASEKSSILDSYTQDYGAALSVTDHYLRSLLS